MNEDFIPYGRQWVDEEDIRAVADVLRSSWLTTGPLVERCEEALAAKVGARFCGAFSSGTAAFQHSHFSSHDRRRSGEGYRRCVSRCGKNQIRKRK